MSPVATSPLNVAILRNSTPIRPSTKLVLASFRSLIQKSYPDAQISVFCRAEGDEFPDPSLYDLIILTGGGENLIAEDPKQWVKDTFEYVRKVVQNGRSKTKLLGICWGHQAINIALGGEVKVWEQDVKIGVETIKLTPKGVEVFKSATGGKDTLDIQKFHKRYVAQPAPGFLPLAANSEILLAESGRVFTIQGHPELTAEISQANVGLDDGTYTKFKNNSPESKALKESTAPHDGPKIFAAIMDWVSE